MQTVENLHFRLDGMWDSWDQPSTNHTLCSKSIHSDSVQIGGKAEPLPKRVIRNNPNDLTSKMFEGLWPDNYLRDLKLFSEALAWSVQETFEVLGHIIRELPLVPKTPAITYNCNNNPRETDLTDR